MKVPAAVWISLSIFQFMEMVAEEAVVFEAKTMYGSKILQEKIKVGSDLDRTHIFQQVLPSITELSTNVFGTLLKFFIQSPQKIEFVGAPRL